MAKRKSESHRKPNHERWLITYADLITLLMVFFIVMYAMSNVNAQKYQALASSLKSGFNQNSGTNMITNYKGESILNAMDKKIKEDQALKEVQKKVMEYAKKNNLDESIRLTLNERGLVISMIDNVLFNSGEAQLTIQARSILDHVVNIIDVLPNNILVEGHTDNVPISTERFPSNWELSTSRATEVVEFLVHRNISPRRLSAAGYSEYHPVVPNDSDENRALNRRVDIVILRSVGELKTTNTYDEEKNF